MKNLMIILFIISLSFTSRLLFAQAIQVDCSNSRVGIATTPGSHSLKVNGSAELNDDIVFNGSDNVIYGVENLINGYGNLGFSTTNTLAVTGSSFGTNALSVSANGASYAASFNGNININGGIWITDTVLHYSDKRLKKDITSLNGIELLKKMEKFDSRNYKFKNKNELMQLYLSGDVNFQTDTINIINECQASFFRDDKKDQAEVEAMLQLNPSDYKQELLKRYKNEVLKNYRFDKTIGDTLGIIINIPNYDDSKYHFGFIAQEVMEEFPELVAYDKVKKIYGVNYVNFVPILYEAIKAQQQQIENQQQQIAALQVLATAQESDILELKNKNLKSATIDKETTSETVLYQNTPNPFNQSTNIKYYLAEGITEALISVCNLNGTQLKSLKINQAGEGSITIERETLQPGIYLYALVANGELIDTKKMMITE